MFFMSIFLVSDFRQVGGFLWVLWFPPPIKLTAMIQLKYCCESSIKNHIPNPYHLIYFKMCAFFLTCRHSSNIKTHDLSSNKKADGTSRIEELQQTYVT